MKKILNLLLQIFPNSTRFWYLTSRKLVQQFSLHLKEINADTYEVLSIETTGELDRSGLTLPLNLTSRLSIINRSLSLTSLDAISPKEDESGERF